MPRATLTVTIPADVWMHDVLADLPSVTLRVVSANLHDDVGVGVLEIEGDDPLAALARLDEEPAVTRLELLHSDGRDAVVQFETTSPPLLRLVHRAGVPLRTPFEVVDGRARWELTTTRDRLGELGGLLETAGIDFELESVGDAHPRAADGLLTARQREVVLAARDLGYYDVPRTATLTEVAEALGVAKATASDTLHRAESHLVDAFVAEHGPG
jgi:predicted DNA binding protein